MTKIPDLPKQLTQTEDVVQKCIAIAELPKG